MQCEQGVEVWHQLYELVRCIQRLVTSFDVLQTAEVNLRLLRSLLSAKLFLVFHQVSSRCQRGLLGLSNLLLNSWIGSVQLCLSLTTGVVSGRLFDKGYL
jgi:hypothetical protein